MPDGSASGIDVVLFAERVLALLDEASFSTTYKHALLLALIDACLEHVDEHGKAPSAIHPTTLAERVISLYWRQTLVFPGASSPHLLRQSGTGQAEIVSAIATFKSQVGTGLDVTLSEARLSPEWNRLVDTITWKLIEMPLPRLQRVGAADQRFIYSISWDESVRRRDLRAGSFDPLVHLLPSAGDHLARLVGLLRPLIERQWAARVCRYNPGVTDRTGDLEAFLFGADRLGAVRLRLALLEVQGHRCFYTSQPLRRPTDAQVDHFMPWARYPSDAVENLVVASRTANAAKSAHLAAVPHLASWREHLTSNAEALTHIAESNRWPTNADTTLAVARAIYFRLGPGVPLWRNGKLFDPADPDAIRMALAR